MRCSNPRPWNGSRSASDDSRSSWSGRPSDQRLLLRRVLGPVRLVPTRPDVGRPYYQAETALQALELLEPPEGGSNWSPQWRRGESNHLGKNRRSLALTTTYATTRIVPPTTRFAQKCSVFLTRGHCFWNRSKPRYGIHPG